MSCSRYEASLTEVKPSAKASARLQLNIVRPLCYLFGWVSGIVLLFFEKKDYSVRFHAWQSIITFGMLSVAILILNLIPPVSDILYTVLAVLYWTIVALSLVLWVSLILSSYQGQGYRLPVAGGLAHRLLEYKREKCFVRKDVGFMRPGSPVSGCAFNKIIQNWGITRFLKQRFWHQDEIWHVFQSSGKSVHADSRKPIRVNDTLDIAEHKQAGATLQQSYSTLKTTLDGVIRAMALTLELRDPYTAGHQQRVAQLACAMAKEMVISEGQA